jgi:hypothetical protein
VKALEDIERGIGHDFSPIEVFRKDTDRLMCISDSTTLIE